MNGCTCRNKGKFNFKQCIAEGYIKFNYSVGHFIGTQSSNK